MFHEHRRHYVPAEPIQSAAELARKLTEQTWTLCTGFEYDGFWFLNDAISEDGAAEFAVVRAADHLQVESITASWMTPERLERWLARDLPKLRGNDTPCRVENVGRNVTRHRSHRCHLCA